VIKFVCVDCYRDVGGAESKIVGGVVVDQGQRGL